MMDAGLLPHFDQLRRREAFASLGTTIPPQSPVAWASFINGAGPGSHGIFDFIQRHPEQQCTPFFSAAETLPAEGYWNVGEHKLQLPFWPFNHKPPAPCCGGKGRRSGSIWTSRGFLRRFTTCHPTIRPVPRNTAITAALAGMGTPDMLGTYGTYQHFAENGPAETRDEGGGKRSRLTFEGETAKAQPGRPRKHLLQRAAAGHGRLLGASRPAGQRCRDRVARPQRSYCRPANGARGSSSTSDSRGPCFCRTREPAASADSISGGRADLPAVRHAD